jgi:hypothetical protein
MRLWPASAGSDHYAWSASVPLDRVSFGFCLHRSSVVEAPGAQKPNDGAPWRRSAIRRVRNGCVDTVLYFVLFAMLAF